MKNPKYKTIDTEGVLPYELHAEAIKYAKMKTGIGRPVAKQQKYIEAFRDCFKIMQDLKMVKKEFKRVKRNKRSSK